ncbi:SAM-dependent methyltransferase, partial [Escherichia coli]
GSRNPIFSKETHLRLSVAKNYQDLLEAIQNLGPVKTNDGKIAKEHGTLADVSGDLLGRVFDVFLRANFESKGGLGVYLTPNPVKQAMLEIAMHDIDDDDEMRSRLANGDFRFCDPTCGSFGFGSVALSQIDKWIDFKLVLADDKKESLKQKLRD